MSVVDTVLHKIFGTPHERKVKQLRPVIAKIHAARQAMEALDDAALAAKSAEFREKLKNGATLEDIKVEAFAVCQEACDRRLGIFNIFKPEFEFDFSRLGTELARRSLRKGPRALPRIGQTFPYDALRRADDRRPGTPRRRHR